MTELKQNDDKRSKDSGGSDKSDDHAGIPWLVIVCVILIIVTVALIVNEVAIERAAGS
jgi:Flp pilus assembly protein TadB